MPTASPHDPARAWKKLSPRTQSSTLLDIAAEIDWTARLLAGEGGHRPRSQVGQLNVTKARTRLARDRAILELLRSVTPADVVERVDATLAEERQARKR